MTVALVIGFVDGYTADLVADGTPPPFTIYAFLVLGLAGNLWASLFNLYFYICDLPCWNYLNQAQLAPEPNHWAIHIATLAFTFIVYGIRKLGLR